MLNASLPFWAFPAGAFWARGAGFCAGRFWACANEDAPSAAGSSVSAKVSRSGRCALAFKRADDLPAAVLTRLYHRRAIAGTGAYGQRTMRAIQEPDDDVARTVWHRAIDRRGHAHPIAELADGFFRGGADGDDAGHGLECRLEDCLYMDRDQDQSRQALGYDADGLAPLSGQKVMSLVQDDPMRAAHH